MTSRLRDFTSSYRKCNLPHAQSHLVFLYLSLVDLPRTHYIFFTQLYGDTIHLPKKVTHLVGFRIVTALDRHHSHPNEDLLSLPGKKPSVHQQSLSTLRPPLPLTTHLLFHPGRLICLERWDIWPSAAGFSRSSGFEGPSTQSRRWDPPASFLSTVVCSILWIHLSLGGHLGCLHRLASMNTFVWICVFSYLGQTQEQIAKSLCNSISLSDHPSTFCSSCTIVHTHQQGPNILISSFHQPLLPSTSFTVFILVGVKWYLSEFGVLVIYIHGVLCHQRRPNFPILELDGFHTPLESTLYCD